MKAATPLSAVPSPCVNVCRMHVATGWCEGCLRTLDEITLWGGQDDAAKRLVLQRLLPRRIAWRALQAAARDAARGAEPAA